MSRFSVYKSEESGLNLENLGDDIDDDYIVGDNGDNRKGEKKTKESDPLTESDGNVEPNNMALYGDDNDVGRPYISRFLSQMANYEAGVEQRPEDVDPDEEVKEKKKGEKKLGTFSGVFFPCIQNIFGVILFIRLVWVVGTAGVVQGFFIVLICCVTTLITAISMSAIATNGRVASGGSYFMISRALGPEFGGAVGILFYLGTSVAASMYIVGAVEILLNYLAQPMVLFGDLANTAVAFNNYRIYGTCLLILMFICVFLGVKFVSKFSPIALACVLFSILCIYIGIFVANPSRGPEICVVGNRIIRSDIGGNITGWCSKNESAPLYDIYCPIPLPNQTTSEACEYFKNSEVKYVRGIPGIASGMIMENLEASYEEKGFLYDSDKTVGDTERGEIAADITTSFIVLLAIFFPSCTGIMAGSNRSGDLQDASNSIPKGTIAAILVTSFVYLSTVIFFGATVRPELLKDKFGESIHRGLVVAHLAWPHPMVILIGSFLSTIGAGLQSLTGAPRLLQAIAQDGVIPFLAPFAVTTRGEPLRALLLTACITEIGVLIASLDYIAPIITMFFLMCYGFVNLACAVQTLLRTPNWRPRFKYYHWVLSLFGVALCLTLMFISSWIYAIVAICIALGIYKYIEFKGAEKEWGDGIRGLAMSAARYALLRLEEGPPHVKNWRPQVLILVKMDGSLEPKHPKTFAFASQLKAGKGLTIVTNVMEGDMNEVQAEAVATEQVLRNRMKEYKVKGFAEVVVAKKTSEGISHLVQTAGLGGMKHNTVMIGWPYGWRHEENKENWRIFIDTLHNISACQHAVLIPKGIDQFPTNDKKMRGTIDLWWIVHDGGLLMLLPFLLSQHRVWKNCKMRIFTVAQMADNSIQMKKDLMTFMYHLRLSADVNVVEMPDSDISAYTYERTLMMEQRNEMMKEMKLKGKRKVSLPQQIVDNAHKISPVSPDKKPTSPVEIKITVDSIPEDETVDSYENHEVRNSNMNQFTFSPPRDGFHTNNVTNHTPDTNKLLNMKPSANLPDSNNVRRMHTAVRLNEVIVEKSHDAQLVIINLPSPPRSQSGEQNYMEYLEVLTEGLERVVMVRGGGREVITMYS